MVDTPRGEAEFYEGGDMDELSKQLEKERYCTTSISVSVRTSRGGATGNVSGSKFADSAGLT